MAASEESADVAREDRVKAVTFAVAKLDALARVPVDVRASRVRPLGVAAGDGLAVDDALQWP